MGTVLNVMPAVTRAGQRLTLDTVALNKSNHLLLWASLSSVRWDGDRATCSSGAFLGRQSSVGSLAAWAPSGLPLCGLSIKSSYLCLSFLTSKIGLKGAGGAGG